MTPEQLARSGSEDGHQAALFCWAQQNERQWPMLKWLHAIPNGGQRSAQVGARMKMTGTRKGILDVVFPVPVWCPIAGTTPGLVIEMKRPGSQKMAKGRLTKEQKQYAKHLTFYGYSVHTCYTWEEARDVLVAYLAKVGGIESYRKAMEDD